MNNFYNVDFLINYEFWIGTILFVAFSYLIGSLNFGQIFSKFKKNNLGKKGSKNYGATNAAKVWGRKYFAIIFSLDVLKIVFLGFIFNWLYKIGNTYEIEIFSLASINIAIAFGFVGHIYPIFFGFKGGKGLACAFGVSLIYNWVLALSSILLYGILLGITRDARFSGVISTWFGCILIGSLQIFFPPQIIFQWTMNWTIFIGLGIMFVLIYYTHYKKEINMFFKNLKKK